MLARLLACRTGLASPLASFQEKFCAKRAFKKWRKCNFSIGATIAKLSSPTLFVSFKDFDEHATAAGCLSKVSW